MSQGLAVPFRPDRGPRKVANLSDLVGPERLALFQDHYVAKSRLFLPGAGPVEGLLPWTEIDRLFATGAIPADQFRVVVNRNTAPPGMYLDPDTGRVRAEAIQELASHGGSFIITGISLLVPAIAQLAKAIERELKHDVNINCYLTFGEYSAFHIHADVHDVIVLQLQGSKHWRCYGEEERYPLRRGRRSSLTEPLWDAVLTPGDVLYVPRGDAHAAIPVDRPSVHLTIGVSETTGVDLLKWLALRAGESEVFRRNLQRNASPADQAARASELRQALHELVDASSLEAYWAHEDRRRSFIRASALNFAARLTPKSMLVSELLRRQDLNAEAPGDVGLQLGGETYRLSQLSRRALQAATEQGPLSFAALAGVLGRRTDDHDLVEALQVLVDSGLMGLGFG